MTTDLFNDLWEDAHDPRLYRGGAHSEVERVKGIYGHYRRMLREAQAFNLNDDAVRLMTDLSHVDPKRVRDRLSIARLPFPITWIEFNFKTRVQRSIELGSALEAINEDTPERVGYLLCEDAYDPTRWSMTQFVSKKDRPHASYVRAGIMPAVFLVDMQRRGFQSEATQQLNQFCALDAAAANPDATDREANILRQEIPRWASMGWGFFGREPQSSISNPYGLEDAVDPPELKGGISVAFEMMNAKSFDEGGKASPEALKRDIQQLFKCIGECRGDVRLMVTILAILNEVPVQFVPAGRRGHFMTSKGNKPYLRTNTVHISLPMKRVRYVVDRRLRNAEVQARKAWHRVRGHDRTSDKYHPGWEWGYSERYERYRWKKRIEAHTRGDPALGIIEHDYEVTT